MAQSTLLSIPEHLGAADVDELARASMQQMAFVVYSYRGKPHTLMLFTDKTDERELIDDVLKKIRNVLKANDWIELGNCPSHGSIPRSRLGKWLFEKDAFEIKEAIILSSAERAAFFSGQGSIGQQSPENTNSFDNVVTMPKKPTQRIKDRSEVSIGHKLLQFIASKT